MNENGRNSYQKKIKDRLEMSFNGCLILKTDPNDIQGIPDLLILYNDKWAALETKKAETSSYRPNQKYYIEIMNDMSFASVIFPENENLVFIELYSHFHY